MALIKDTLFKGSKFVRIIEQLVKPYNALAIIKNYSFTNEISLTGKCQLNSVRFCFFYERRDSIIVVNQV